MAQLQLVILKDGTQAVGRNFYRWRREGARSIGRFDAIQARATQICTACAAKMEQRALEGGKELERIAPTHPAANCGHGYSCERRQPSG